MNRDFKFRNILFTNKFRGQVTGINGDIISYNNRVSWLSEELDKLFKETEYNIYYFNDESSTLDEYDKMTLIFHADAPKSEMEAIKRLIYDESDGGILKEDDLIKNGKWDDDETVFKKQTSTTLTLKGVFVYEMVVNIKKKDVSLNDVNNNIYNEIKGIIASVLKDDYRYHFGNTEITAVSNAADIEIMIDLSYTFTIMDDDINEIKYLLEDRYQNNVKVKIMERNIISREY